MSRKFAVGHNRGFSLIEVLVAVTILSVGLIALATLQIALVRSAASTKAQSQALSLAKDKLEELRTFTTIAGYQAINTGSDTPSIGNVAYTRTWTVSRYVYNQDVDNDGTLNEANDQRFESVGTLTGPTPTSPSGLVAGNEFKVIKVVSGWTEASGQTASVSLVDATGSISPSDSSLINKLALGTSARRIPVVINNPALDNMVIPIAIGGGSNSAATNPKPQIVIGTSTVETQFDVLTYGALSGDTAVAQQRVETDMVGCTCDFGQAPASTVRGKRPTYWDGKRYTVPVAATYAPPAGVDVASVNLQSPRCDICCRDHNDPVGVTGALFSPLLATRVSGIVTAAHPHYFNKSAGAPTLTGTFKEACRLIRVDGQWRVAADLNDDYYGLLATGDGTTAATYVPDSTSVQGSTTVVGAVRRYQAFVLDYMTGRFITPSPTSSTAQGVYNTVGAPGTLANPYDLAASNTYVLRNPTTIAIALHDTVGKWLHSRGLYIDFLEQDAVNAILDAKADASCNVDTATLSTCILRLLPFTSINLTEIADWTSADAAKLAVTNNNYGDALNYGYPVRGQETSNALAAISLDITSSSRHSNSGLLDLSFDSISPSDDRPTPYPAVAAAVNANIQHFDLGGGSTPPTTGNGLFYVNLSLPGSATRTPAVTYTTGVQASVGCSTGSPVTNNTCSVQNGSSTAGLGVANTMSFTVLNYNHTAPTTVTASIGCTGPVGNKTWNPSGQESYIVNTCKNYQIASATNTTSGGTASITAPTAPPGGTNGLLTESTRVSFPMINANDVISVAMTLEGTTTQSATCTYTCSTPNSGPADCTGSSKATYTVTSPTCP